MKDVSILIVHYNTPRLLRQTLKGIERAASRVSHEVILVDNNPDERVIDMVREEFPHVKLIVSPQNEGFGRGMNRAIDVATGRYVFVFNPDIVMLPGVLEELTEYMDAHGDVGMVGPRLSHPDGTLQHSCYRFMKPSVILYRRVPVLRWFAFAKRAVHEYMMVDKDHSQTQDVDYLLGAAMFIRRKALDQVGGFDPKFFVYFEDQDLCRRFWKMGWRVVYHPLVELIHYHRRETAEGGFFKQLFNPLTRIQIQSAVYYYQKYKDETHPRLS
jgi:N-acetylglucosaminyl-diphospho-decaprenol L-rhamnosyltransferase